MLSPSKRSIAAVASKTYRDDETTNWESMTGSEDHQPCCWKALAGQLALAEELKTGDDSRMQARVAFCQVIERRQKGRYGS